MSENVYIIGAGIHPFGRTDGRSGREQGVHAVREALSDAGLEWPDIECAYGGSAAAGNADIMVNELGLTSLPFTNVANGCATGGSALAASQQAIARLHALGIQTVMLTGDNPGSAQAVAQALGIDEVHAQLLPDDKARIIGELRNRGDVVAMVGDGLNDAPSLVAADVGLAVSTGTDVAMEAAGITLMRGDPRLVADAIDVSRRTYGKIKQGLFWAFVYNTLGIPLAAFGMLSPVVAGAAMAFSSVSVVLNALTLRRWRASAR